MPKETSGTHTAESIGHVAKRLEEIVAQLQVAKSLLELPPTIESVDVPREAARELGLQRIGAWADSVRDAVHAARLNSLRNGKLLSDSPGNRKKPSKR